MALPLIPAAFAIKAGTALAREFLPGLVGAIAGNKGEAVARAVLDSAVAVAVKPGEAAEPEAIAATLRASPELVVEFKARVLEHAEVMARLDNADRADARARDVAVRQSGRGNRRADGLAFLAFMLFAVVVLRLVWQGIPADAGQVLLVLLGQLSALVAAVYHFEFGSSGGSKDKAAVIAGRPQ